MKYVFEFSGGPSRPSTTSSIPTTSSSTFERGAPNNQNQIFLPDYTIGRTSCSTTLGSRGPIRHLARLLIRNMTNEVYKRSLDATATAARRYFSATSNLWPESQVDLLIIPGPQSWLSDAIAQRNPGEGRPAMDWAYALPDSPAKALLLKRLDQLLAKA